MQLREMEGQFLSAYRRFLDANPERIKHDPVQSDIIALARELRKAANAIEKLHSENKVVQHTSKSFTHSWREYCETWRVFVSWRSNFLDDRTIVLDPLPFEEFQRRSIEVRGRIEFDPRQYPIDFNPDTKIGGSAIQQMFEAVEEIREETWEALPEDYWESDDPTVEDTIALYNKLNVGLQAFRFFEAQMGIKVTEAFTRWNKLPTILMPSELGTRRDETSKNSLYELLKDAIRAYLAGSTAASVAMCRAALEVVLKEYYLAGYPLNPREDGLSNLINIATKKYEFLADQEDKMTTLRKSANKALHGYSTRHSAKVEDLILTFFQDLKHWIDMAPEKSQR